MDRELSEDFGGVIKLCSTLPLASLLYGLPNRLIVSIGSGVNIVFGNEEVLLSSLSFEPSTTGKIVFLISNSLLDNGLLPSPSSPFCSLLSLVAEGDLL